MFNSAFWKAAAERAIKTFAQAALGALAAAGMVSTTDAVRMDLAAAFHAAGIAGLVGAILSILTSMASAPIGKAGPSLAGETLVTDATPGEVAAGDAA